MLAAAECLEAAIAGITVHKSNRAEKLVTV